MLITSMSEMVGASVAEVKGNLRAAQAVSRQVEDGTALLSAGVCCIKMGVYGTAKGFLDRATEVSFDDPEVFFFAAVAELEGKKPFLSQLSTIRHVESLLEAASMLEGKPVYSLLAAFVARDYYERKYLRPSQPSAMLLQQAIDEGLTQLDVELLTELLKVPVNL